jgi:hypothetical protein
MFYSVSSKKRSKRQSAAQIEHWAEKTAWPNSCQFSGCFCATIALKFAHA